MSEPLVARPRREEDLAALAVLIEETHRLDGYPFRWPPGGLTGPDAPLRFLDPPETIGAWAVDDDEGVAGQVVLMSESQQGTEAWSALTGRPDGTHAVVSRLVVAPRARGRAGMRVLLAACVAEAEARGLLAVLDVFHSNPGALAGYRRLGWRELGEGEFVFSDGMRNPMTYFAAPSGSG